MNDLAYVIEQCRIVNYADYTNIHCFNKDVLLKKNLNIDLEKPNPDKYQSMVLGKMEDKRNFKLADIDNITTDKTFLLGVVFDNELKFDDHISSIYRKVRAQMSPMNRLKNISPLKTKESLYRAFILPYFNNYNQVGTTAEKRNVAKIEKVNETL